jgi:chromosome segregation ATPase
MSQLQRRLAAEKKSREAAELQLNDTRQKLTEQIERCNQMESEQRRINDDYRLLKETAERDSVTLKQTSKQIEEVQETNRKLEKQLALAKTELSQSSERQTQFTAQIENLLSVQQEQSGNTQNELVTLREQLSIESEAQSILRAELDDAHKNYALLECELRDTSRQLADKVCRIDELNGIVENVRGVLEKELRYKSEMASVQAQLESNYQQINNELEQVHQQLEEMKAEKLALETELHEYQQQQRSTSDSTITSSATAQMVEQAAKERATLEQMLLDVQVARDEAFDRANRLEVTESVMTADLLKLRNKVAEQEDELKRVKLDYEEQLDSLNGEIQVIEEELRFVRACNQALVKEKDRWTQYADNHNDTSAPNDDDNQNVTDSISTPSRPVLRRMATKLDKARLKDLQHNLAIVTRKVEELELENSKLRYAVRHRDREIERLLAEAASEQEPKQFDVVKHKKPVSSDKLIISFGKLLNMNQGVSSTSQRADPIGNE